MKISSSFSTPSKNLSYTVSLVRYEGSGTQTEDEYGFYVVGLLMESSDKADISFRHFKKSIQNYKINPNVKAKVFTEFKASILDRRHQRIKIKMLEEISKSGEAVYYAYYQKHGDFKQDIKEQVYIDLLLGIVSNIQQNIDIVFDRFQKLDFETRIIETLSEKTNVESIIAGDSQIYSGLKYVDNICSSIRLHEAGADNYGFFSMICNIVHKLDF